MAEVLLAVHWPFAFPDFNGASRLTRVPNTTSGPTLWKLLSESNQEEACR
jgi:hypothetical protein